LSAGNGSGRLRVLYLSDVAWPRVNGVSTSIAVFRRELLALGHEVPLLAPRYGEPAAPDDPAIVRLDGRRVPFDPEDRFVPARRFVQAAAALDFDLVHVQTPFAAHVAGRRIARRRGAPLVETWHTDFEHYFEHYVPFVPAFAARAVARTIARRVGRGVDHLIVPSSDIDDAIGAYGVSTPRTVLPTGLAAGELGPGDGAAFRSRHGIHPHRPVVVHVGRIAGEKNLDFLLRAVAAARREVPELLFVIAGEGPAKPALRHLASELGFGDSILWLGYLDRRTELADVYSAGDLFAFASVTETQGLVLLEAMSLGVPVVAIAERGTRDLLAARRGGLVAEHDLESFAAAMLRLLRDRELRARSSTEARDVAAAWSAPVFAVRLVGLYERLVDEARLTAPRRAASFPAMRTDGRAVDTAMTTTTTTTGTAGGEGAGFA
jgi:glycosyltransferase involved in cell wall biosynthesis